MKSGSARQVCLQPADAHPCLPTLPDLPRHPPRPLPVLPSWHSSPLPAGYCCPVLPRGPAATVSLLPRNPRSLAGQLHAADLLDGNHVPLSVPPHACTLSWSIRAPVTTRQTGDPSSRTSQARRQQLWCLVRAILPLCLHVAASSRGLCCQDTDAVMGLHPQDLSPEG